MTALRHISPLLICMLVLSPLYAAAPHDHHEHGPAELALDHGKKWASDAPLRQRMANLRAAFAEHAQAIHKGSLPPAGYQALGEKTETEVAGIVAECKLDPRADAMLHLVIADMLAGAEVMRGKAAGQPASGAKRVIAALNQYGRHFEHPGWQPLR
jgi:hypothetical protein